MKQITTLLLLLVTLAAQSAWAQKLSVESFIQDQRKVYGSTEARLDGTGEQYCALVLVQLPTLQGVTFDGEIVNPIEPRGGEYWVYMVAGSKYLRIKHPSVHPLEVTFADYGIASLQSKATYVLTINVPQLAPGQQDDGFRFFSMTVKPITAKVKIDNELVDLQEDGTFMNPMPQGKHQYEVSMTGYATQTGTFTIADKKVSLKVTLEQALTQLTVSCPTDGAAIYINEEKKSNSKSWSGTLSPATYIVEARKNGFTSQRKVIALQQGQPQTLTLPALIARTGTLSVSYAPEDAEVYLDGQKLGTSPDIFRNVPIGSHQVELRKEGYASVTQNVSIEEGKTATLSGRLAQKGSQGNENGKNALQRLGNNDYSQDQTIVVSGQVVSETDNEPLIGTAILKKNTFNGTVSDIDGNFGLRVSSNAVLVFSYIGFETKEVPVDGRSSLGVIKMEEEMSANKQYKMGYRYEQKNNLEDAVRWYKKAAARGNNNAKKALKRLGK